MGRDDRDPGTLIALFFRIVDEPRRTMAAAGLVVLVMGAAILAWLPVAELAGNRRLWGGGACLAGLGWLLQRVVRSAHTSCCHKHRDTCSGRDD